MVRRNTPQGFIRRHSFGEYIRQRIEERDGAGCNNCHRTNIELVVHHVQPLSEGGSNNFDNLILLCRTCHMYVHGGNIEKLIERAILNEDYC